MLSVVMVGAGEIGIMVIERLDLTRQYASENREVLAAERRGLDEIYRRHALGAGGSEYVVEMALDDESEVFATTPLYWECDCEWDYIRSSSVSVCVVCGVYAEDSADSRINEVFGEELVLDLGDPALRGGLEFHSVGYL